MPSEEQGLLCNTELLAIKQSNINNSHAPKSFQGLICHYSDLFKCSENECQCSCAPHAYFEVWPLGVQRMHEPSFVEPSNANLSKVSSYMLSRIG